MSAELKALFRLDLSSVAADAKAAAAIIQAQFEGIKLGFAKGGKSGLGQAKGEIDDLGKSADNTSNKILKSFSILDAWGKSVFKNMRDEKGLMKVWDDAVVRGAKSENPVLKAWREQMAGGVHPDMKVSMASMAKGFGGSENPMQESSDEFGAGGLITAGQGLPKTHEEATSERSLRIKKEAIEARRKDLMEKDAVKSVNDRARFYKDLTFLMMPAFNPGSVWATLFSSRQTFTAMMTEKGQEGIGKVGLHGIKGAGLATAALVAASTAAGYALKGLRAAIDGAIASYNKAAAMYAKSLTSGVGLGFSVHREILSSIIGVSEKDLFQFGAAIAYLNPKIEDASKILAGTAPRLTEVSWAWKVLMVDMSALFAEIGYKLAPLALKIAGAFDYLVKALTLNLDIIVDYINILAAPSIAGKMLAYAKLKVDQERKEKGMGPNFNQSSFMPAPVAFMKQLQTSAWEKMGLVIGGKTTNWSMQTAQNTKKANELLFKLIKTVSIGLTADPGPYVMGMSMP